MTTKYRKKPVEVEARQLTYADAHDVANWVFQYADASLNIDHSERKTMDDFLRGQVWMEIHTLEGKMRVNQNDWIVKGVKDEIYPVRQDIFQETYEEVSA